MLALLLLDSIAFIHMVLVGGEELASSFPQNELFHWPEAANDSLRQDTREGKKFKTTDTYF